MRVQLKPQTLQTVDYKALTIQLQAQLDERVLDKVLDTLASEEVFNVEDLHVLHGEAGFRELFTKVTGRKIQNALLARAALPLAQLTPMLSPASVFTPQSISMPTAPACTHVHTVLQQTHE